MTPTRRTLTSGEVMGLTGLFATRGLPVFDGKRPYDLTLFGIRRTHDPDRWNDVIGVLYRKTAKSPLLGTIFAATTDPGGPALVAPPNPNGTAILAPGHTSGLWKIGVHHGASGDRMALVQNVPVAVYRDRNRDGSLDPSGPVDVGYFGINLHDGGNSTSPLEMRKVGPWSAGCQVIARKTDHLELMDLCAKQKTYHPSWAFSYSLLDAEQAPDPVLDSIRFMP